MSISVSNNGIFSLFQISDSNFYVILNGVPIAELKFEDMSIEKNLNKVVSMFAIPRINDFNSKEYMELCIEPLFDKTTLKLESCLPGLFPGRNHYVEKHIDLNNIDLNDDCLLTNNEHISIFIPKDYYNRIVNPYRRPARIWPQDDVCFIQ